MKYFVRILVIFLVVGGILLGFNLGRNKASNNTGTTNDGSVSTVKSSANVKILDQSGKGLNKVGQDIYSQTGVTDLILSNNSIQTLPSEIGKMTNVINFKIDHNILDGSLIGEIRQMSRLKTLDLSYNKMTGMPAEIGQLTKLESLDYSYNDISGLPNELSNLKNNLKEFKLTSNPLSQEQINKLKSLLPNTTIIF